MTDEIKKEKLKGNEVDGTAEAFEEFVNEKERTCRELSDDTLEEVSGGGSWSTHSSGDTPKFKVGECVIFYDGLSYYKYYSIVKAVSKEKSGSYFPEFTYTIEIFAKERVPVLSKYEPKLTKYDVWESDLTPAERPAGM